jgi:hypothetical protein
MSITRLPGGSGQNRILHVHAPRGALRPRARHDRRCNPKSPLGELSRPDNVVNQKRGRGQQLGHVLIAVRQGRLPREAIAAGEEQLGGCAARRLYLRSGKLALVAVYLRRVQVAGRSFASGVPPPAHV